MNLPDQDATWALWYSVGAVPDVPTASGVIATRTGNAGDSQPLKVTAYVGPFGVFVDEGTFSPGPGEPRPFNGLDISTRLAEIHNGHGSGWAVSEVSDAVDHVVLEYPGGTRQVVKPVMIGGFRFVADFVQAGRPPLRAVSYNAAGGVIAVSDANHDVGLAATSSAP